MDEIVSWIGVALIALGALVGFTGVVTTSVMLGVRHLAVARADGHSSHARSGALSPR
jgi:hypothetical protein